MQAPVSSMLVCNKALAVALTAAPAVWLPVLQMKMWPLGAGRALEASWGAVVLLFCHEHCQQLTSAVFPILQMKSWPCRGAGRGLSSPTWGAPASPSWCASTMREACLTPTPVRCPSPLSTHTGWCRLARLCLCMQWGEATCMPQEGKTHTANKDAADEIATSGCTFMYHFVQYGKATGMPCHTSVHPDMAISSAASLSAVCVLPSWYGCCKLLQCLQQMLRDQGAPTSLRPPAGCTAALELSSALGCSSLWIWASSSCACSRSRSQQVGRPAGFPRCVLCIAVQLGRPPCSLDRLTRSVVLPALSWGDLNGCCCMLGSSDSALARGLAACPTQSTASPLCGLLRACACWELPCFLGSFPLRLAYT